MREIEISIVHQEHERVHQKIVGPAIICNLQVTGGVGHYFRVTEKHYRNKRKDTNGQKGVEDFTEIILVFGKTGLNFFIEESVTPYKIEQYESEARNHKIPATNEPDALKKERPVHSINIRNEVTASVFVYLTDMKNRDFLAVSAVLVSPGAYAIINWFLIDAHSKGKKMSEMESLYAHVLPVFQSSFAAQRWILLGMALVALYFVLRNRTLIRDSFLRRVFRKTIMVVAILEAFFLLFSMM